MNIEMTNHGNRGTELMYTASVIICTHNPHVRYLQRVLDSLSAQTIPSTEWELLVIDNASVTPVSQVADLRWHPHARHLLEPKLGLTAARQCGIEHATGELLIFVDDDNVLAPEYLAEALRIAKQYPFLGAWGSGAIDPEFEVEPAEHVRLLLPWLGVRHADQPIWANVKTCTDAIPFGAGMCVRREIGLAYVEHCRSSSTKITGRKGTSLAAHDDFEICYLACEAGLGMGIFPELKLLHLINKNRVTDDHFVRLVEGGTTSKLLLANKWGGTKPKPFFTLQGVGSIVVNLISRRGFDRQIYFAELRAVRRARRLISGDNFSDRGD
jgi:glycosyltransferase involved in cell wall biosynthesis